MDMKQLFLPLIVILTSCSVLSDATDSCFVARNGNTELAFHLTCPPMKIEDEKNMLSIVRFYKYRTAEVKLWITTELSRVDAVRERRTSSPMLTDCC